MCKDCGNSGCVDITDILNDPQKMKKFQEAYNAAMDKMQEDMDREAKELGVSSKAIGLIFYLRSRARWTQERENEIIRMDKNGEKLPEFNDI